MFHTPFAVIELTVISHSSEKHHTATTITTLASPIEFDKMSRSGGLASTFGPSNASQPMAAPTEERPLPPVPAQGKPSWHDKYFAPSHDPSISNDIDIEAALERHDNHRPNRILAGFWHANNPAPPPATHGVYMGNCNGLRL